MQEKGVAIYLALIIMFVLLGIGLGLSSILIGQIKMIRGIGHSVPAFYAADSGAERALYGFFQKDDKSTKTAILGSGTSCTTDPCYEVSLCHGKIQSTGSYKDVKRAVETTYPRQFAFVVVSGFEDLQVVEVTDITPTCGLELSGTYAYGDRGEDIFIDGSIGYLAEQSLSSLIILNVEDPNSIQVLGSLPAFHFGTTVVASGDYVFSGGGSDFSSVNVLDPSAPFIEKTISGPGTVRGSTIDIANDRIYVAADFNGIWIVDITDPTDPVFIDSVETPGRAWFVAANNNLVYVGDGTGGLQIIDPFSTPPAVIGFYQDADSGTNGIFVVNDRAYLADDYKFRVIDVSDPTNPSLLGEFLMTYTTDVYVINDIAYVTDEVSGQGGLRAIDVTDPASMNLLEEISFTGWPWRLFVK